MQSQGPCHKRGEKGAVYKDHIRLGAGNWEDRTEGRENHTSKNRHDRVVFGETRTKLVVPRTGGKLSWRGRNGVNAKVER